MVIPLTSFTPSSFRLQEAWKQLLHPYIETGTPGKRFSISSGGKTRSTLSGGKSRSSISSTTSTLSPRPADAVTASRSSSMQSDQSLLGELHLLDAFKNLDPAAVLQRVSTHHRVTLDDPYQMDVELVSSSSLTSNPYGSGFR